MSLNRAGFINQARRSRQTGIGLIEVLVTVVLLSIGFLAAAQMQVQGMRFSQSAYFQSQAYFLASDMMNRMRANIDAVELGDYDDIVTSAAPNDPRCKTQACSPSQLAQQDLLDWSSYFHALNGEPNFIPALPSSPSIPASATVVPLGNGIYSVRLLWSEEIDGQAQQQNLQVNFAVADAQ